ncbi:hypothetical protein HK098_000618 [Nowakowskiella sp. JEL0407]|nr:hypothetical protein HK098_000618 [Nowakowskiella sp. JEL0407]
MKETNTAFKEWEEFISPEVKMEAANKSKTVESADYHLPDTINHRQRMLGVSTKHIWYTEGLYLLLTIFIAVVIALVTAIVYFSFGTLGELRYQLAEYIITEDPFTLFIAYVVNSTIMITLVVASSCLMIYAPMAVGSGIPGVIAYLNGIRIPDVLSLKTLLAKSFGLILAVSSGLPVGPTGPMIHVGACLGSLITRQLHRFRKSKQKPLQKRFASIDAIERDFVAIGAGCGISAAMSAPIGGVLFVLEEIASFFELGMLKRLFFGCFAAFFVVQLYNVAQHTYTVISQRAGNLLCNHKHIGVVDAFLYAIVGVFGGLIGAAFNAAVCWVSKDPVTKPKAEKNVDLERTPILNQVEIPAKEKIGEPKVSTAYQAYVNSPNWWKVRNTVIFAVLVSTIQIFLPYFFTCKPLDSHVFLDSPSMCFSLANERQLFEGIAYIAGKGIDSSVFKSQDSCLRFSREQSVESVLENSAGKQKEEQNLEQEHEEQAREEAFGPSDENNEEERSSSTNILAPPQSTFVPYGRTGVNSRRNLLEKRSIAELVGLTPQTQSKWDGWSSGFPGMEAVGYVLPIPIPGAYNICKDNQCQLTSANISISNNMTTTIKNQNSTSKLLPFSGVPVSVNWAMRYTCPKNYYNPMASLILNPMSRAVRLLFLRGAPLILELPVLITFFCVFFVMVVLNFQSFLPGGTILPQLLLGATYGRIIGIFGVWVNKILCSEWTFLPSIALSRADTPKWAETGGSCLTVCKSTPDPSRYALVGAASIWGGINRLTLFVAMVMTELTDDLGQIPPMIIGIFFAVLVGNRINKGLFQMLIKVKGWPFLEPNAPFNYESVSCESITKNQSVISVPQACSISKLKSILSHPYPVYPVVNSEEDKKLVGYILRKRLVQIVFDMTVDEPEGKSNKQEILGTIKTTKLDNSDEANWMDVDFEGLEKSTKNADAIANIDLGISASTQSLEFEPTISNNEKQTDESLNLNLYQHMDLSPLTIQSQVSVAKAYSLFRRMGLRHLLVVNGENQVIGIITRRDLAYFNLKRL